MSTYNQFSPGAINAVLKTDTTAGGTSVALPAGVGQVLRVVNSSTVPAMIALGDSKVTVAGAGTKTSANSGGYAIPGSGIEFITLNPDATTLVGITESSSTVLWINRGEGAR